MGKYLAKKGFIHYLSHKKWSIKDILEPLLILPFAFILQAIAKDGVTPINLIISLAGLAYLTILFRWYRK